jgi:hypothetical protein
MSEDQAHRAAPLPPTTPRGFLIISGAAMIFMGVWDFITFELGIFNPYFFLLPLVMDIGIFGGLIFVALGLGELTVTYNPFGSVGARGAEGTRGVGSESSEEMNGNR